MLDYNVSSQRQNQNWNYIDKVMKEEIMIPIGDNTLWHLWYTSRLAKSTIVETYNFNNTNY